MHNLAASRVGKSRRKAIIIIIGIMIIGGVLCLWLQHADLQTRSANTDEQKVYRAVLKKILSDEKERGDAYKFYVNARTLKTPNDIDSISKRLETLQPATLEDFQNQNKKSYVMPEIGGGFDYVMKEFDEIDAIFHREDDFEAYNSIITKILNRDMIICFSSVGFSPDQAMVYVFDINIVGGIWTSKAVFLLSKENNEWVIEETAPGTSVHIGLY